MFKTLLTLFILFALASSMFSKKRSCSHCGSEDLTSYNDYDELDEPHTEYLCNNCNKTT